jgi:hypothetical protein
MTAFMPWPARRSERFQNGRSAALFFMKTTQLHAEIEGLWTAFRQAITADEKGNVFYDIRIRCAALRVLESTPLAARRGRSRIPRRFACSLNASAHTPTLP